VPFILIYNTLGAPFLVVDRPQSFQQQLQLNLCCHAIRALLCLKTQKRQKLCVPFSLNEFSMHMAHPTDGNLFYLSYFIMDKLCYIAVVLLLLLFLHLLCFYHTMVSAEIVCIL